MDESTVNLSKGRPGTGWLRSMATYGLHTLERSRTWIFSAVSLAWVCFVLALLLLPDLMSRRTQASMTPPFPRKLPLPIHDRGQVYALMPDGSREKMTDLSASTYMKAWVDAVGAAYVYERTKLPD